MDVDWLKFLFEDERTKKEKIIDDIKFYSFIIAILSILIGIGILIGKYCLN